MRVRCRTAKEFRSSFKPRRDLSLTRSAVAPANLLPPMPHCLQATWRACTSLLHYVKIMPSTGGWRRMARKFLAPHHRSFLFNYG